MAATYFPRALANVLKHEGGYVNHPKDPGGATNKGVTQRTYDAWRDSQRQQRMSVQYITDDEVKAIYRRNYWDAVQADQLAGGLDYATFDFAVNSGPSRSVRYLSEVSGYVPRTKVDAGFLAHLRLLDAGKLIRSLCAKRRSFLQGLGHFKTFGKGWMRRVATVEAVATRMHLEWLGVNNEVVKDHLTRAGKDARQQQDNADKGVAGGAAVGSGGAAVSWDPSTVEGLITFGVITLMSIVVILIMIHRRRERSVTADAYYAEALQ